MVMGTFANIYAIQQSLSSMKTVDKNIAETKEHIPIDLTSNKLAKQQLNNESNYTLLIIILMILLGNVLYILK